MMNEYGQVTIDEVAANQDITNIGKAMQKLEESKNTIRQLQNNALQMHGRTGSAIANKCVELTNYLDQLHLRLDTSAKFIRRTVEKYKEEDREVAYRIRSGKGV